MQVRSGRFYLLELELEKFILQGLYFRFSQKPNNKYLLSYWWIDIKLQALFIYI